MILAHIARRMVSLNRELNRAITSPSIPARGSLSLRHFRREEIFVDLRKTLSRLMFLPAALVVLPAFIVGVAAYREAFRRAIYGRRFEVIAYPPDWQSALAGAALALAAFFIALHALRRLVNLGFRITGRLASKKRKATEYPNWPD
jgi:hypothetical protein